MGSVLLLGGCNLVGVDCTTEIRTSLVVHVVDSVTSAPLPDPLVWVKDGSFQDTLATRDGEAAGPAERPGIYEVHVEHEGYAPWVRTGVLVTEDECHVRTREILARLQPIAE